MSHASDSNKLELYRPNGKHTSKVWKYFKRSKADKSNVYCQVEGCNNPKIKSTTNSTTNLQNHIINHHPNISKAFQTVNPDEQRTLSEFTVARRVSISHC